MRMIGCVSPVSAGELRIFGLDPAPRRPAIRARIGVVPQADQLDAELTVLENLVIYGRYFDISRRRVQASGPPNCSTSSSSPTAPTARSTRCPAGMKRRVRSPAR